MVRFQNQFFFALLAVIAGLSILVFLPYLTSLVLALVCAVFFFPLHRKVLKFIETDNEQSSIGAIITLVIIVVFIITPLVFLTMRVSSEAQSVYGYLADPNNSAKISENINNLAHSFGARIPGFSSSIALDSPNISNFAQGLLSWGFANVGNIFVGFAKFALDISIFLFALFYLLRDGRELKKQVISFSPLLDAYDEEIFNRLGKAISSVVKGSLVVGIIQGFQTGLGFFMFGVPNPVLFGSFAVISALIPGIGTALVLVPGIIYLFLSGATGNALGLLMWGIVAVGLIDNFLGPYLVHRGVKTHQFFVLISVLGGLSYFGPIGFVLGPMIVSFFLALLDIYKMIIVKGEGK